MREIRPENEAAFESFEQAFRGRINGCRRDCECGIVFYDTYNSGYDWEDGEVDELARLAAEGKAKPVGHSVGLVEFEGRYFVDACTCWHERAKKIIGFLLGHDEAIADFLRREKARKIREAAAAPTVSDENP